jgi:SlyX protein
MHEDRIIELEIKLAYQEDLIQALNQVVIDHQKQLGKLEETCKLLNGKIKSLILDGHESGPQVDERPPHY